VVPERRKPPWTWVAALASMLLLAGCGSGGGSHTRPAGDVASKAAVQIPEVIRVGSEIPYAPFEFGKPPYRGFDVDLVTEISRRLGSRARFVNRPFNALLRDLGRRKFDMVAAGAVITPAWRQKASFSHPYLPADLAVTVTKGSDVKSHADLAGRTLGVQRGSSGADYARANTKARSVRAYALIDDALNALAAGQVDAVIHEYPVSRYAERSRRNLAVVETIATDRDYGFAFPKALSLESRVNETLDAIKRDGTYTRIYRKWFNADPRG
jgi:polar amino acid transport system substrate-binding protein